MKEHGIIMSGENPKLIRDGLKTQTRRLLRVQPGKFQHFEDDVDENGEIRLWWDVDKGDGNVDQEYSKPIRCPYGAAGDTLVIRETHWRYGRWVKNGTTKTGRQAWTFKAVRESIAMFEDRGIGFKPKRTTLGWHKRPAIFLPFNLARTRCPILKVRVERLQDISNDDAKAEGMRGGVQSRTLYRGLWSVLYGVDSWDKNPWVWVLEFKRQ